MISKLLFQCKRFSWVQEELFQVIGLPMVDNCMAGYNSCLFAYGQVSPICWHFGDLGWKSNSLQLLCRLIVGIAA
ncbi:hypothetical protein KC19_VG013000 [Ceratodon purpureus]|uniref:Uncharacterized protein n=1 Tax=Ceratodon purpureus TaxID=3225 RepID=A0A8T0HKY2_CERPU|nr:hypothetical protein KC19_VG013000 [Ceratodon purpureus]